ncbi:MAG: hypothetical protein AAGL89_05500 [Pseudomonadota bacterium]
MRFLTSAAFMAASTGAALACPTAADLEAGIVIMEDDGTRNVFTSVRNGVVSQDGVTPDGFEFRTLLAQGVHVLQLADTEDGALIPDTVYTTSYPDPVNTLPIPEAGLTWDVSTGITSFEETYTEQQSQVWGAMVPFSIGECTYDAIPGKVEYLSDLSHFREQIIFVPALGLGLLTSSVDIGFEDEPGTFTYVSISAL